MVIQLRFNSKTKRIQTKDKNKISNASLLTRFNLPFLVSDTLKANPNKWFTKKGILDRFRRKEIDTAMSSLSRYIDSLK